MTELSAIVHVHVVWGGATHRAKVFLELRRRGCESGHAVERTGKMVRQIDGPVVLARHSYGGAVLAAAGDLPNVKALVYIAAFAPDAGENPVQISQ